MYVTINPKKRIIPMKSGGLTLVEVFPKFELGVMVYLCKYEKVDEEPKQEDK